MDLSTSHVIKPIESAFSEESGAGRTKKIFLNSSETSRAQIAISIGLCTRRRTGSHTFEPVNQGFSCTVFSRPRYKMCAPAFLVTEVGWKMHSEYLTYIVGGCYQAARPCQEHAKVSAGCTHSKGAPWFGSTTRALLMPFWMVIDTERTVTYNSKLK